jgi:hypothetical protein
MPPWYDVLHPGICAGHKTGTVEPHPHSAKQQLFMAKDSCLAQFDEVARWLERTHDLVAGAGTYTLEAFRESLAELQQGFLDAELELVIAIFDFERTMEDKTNANHEE